MNILDYNKALDAYNAKPSALTYNNALNVIDTMQNQTGVLGASDTSGSTSGGGGSVTGDDSARAAGYSDFADYQAKMAANAQTGHNATLEAIRNRLNETRRLAQQQISNATGARDYVMNFINERFPQLQQRVAQQRGNQLEDLDTQETTLQTLYDRANAVARRRSESAALKNRNIARAGNKLGSSFYDELVSENQENLGRTLGESDMERIGKIAAIGTQRTRTNQDFDNKSLDLDMQKKQAEQAAITEYNQALQQAEALERAGVLDFGEAEAIAAQNLQSRLDSITQWAQGMAQQRLALSGTYDPGGSFDTALSGFATNNQNFIQQNAPTPAGTNALQYDPTLLAASNTSTATPFVANQGVSTTDDILKRLGIQPTVLA